MNWKLIILLSLFGLAMGIATVFFMPSSIEPVFWLAIFVFSAYAIARGVAARRFSHGLFLGLANSVWVTASHLMFYDRYISTHAQEAAMMKSIPAPEMARMLMAITGPLVGAISGLIIGCFALIAGKLVKSRAARQTAHA